MYDFISIFTMPLTNLGKMVDQYARPQLWNDDVFTISISHDKLLWLYFNFYKPYDNQTLQSLKPECIELMLQMMMIWLSSSDLTNVYDFYLFFYRSYNNQTWQDGRT